MITGQIHLAAVDVLKDSLQIMPNLIFWLVGNYIIKILIDSYQKVLSLEF